MLCLIASPLAELTTGLELALEGSMEDNVPDSEDGADNLLDEEQKEAYSARKKDWEEVLEQAKVVEAMLRQALENGLGSRRKKRNHRKRKRKKNVITIFP